MSELIVPKYYRLPCSTCGTVWQLYCVLQPGELAPRACNYWEGRADLVTVKLPCKHWQLLLGIQLLPKPVRFLSSQTKVL